MGVVSASLRNVLCFALHPKRAGQHTRTHTPPRQPRAAAAQCARHTRTACAVRTAGRTKPSRSMHAANVGFARVSMPAQHRACSRMCAPRLVTAGRHVGAAAERRRRWRHSSARRAPMFRDAMHPSHRRRTWTAASAYACAAARVACARHAYLQQLAARPARAGKEAAPPPGTHSGRGRSARRTRGRITERIVAQRLREFT